MSWTLALLIVVQGVGDDLVARGIPPERAVVPFEVTPEVRGWASSMPQDARGLYDELKRAKRAGFLKADRDNSPKKRTPKTVQDMLPLLRDRNAPGNREAGCYEFTALYVAAARAHGLDAVAVERQHTVGTGQIGHVMAAVREGKSSLQVFDLQNETMTSRYPFRVLSDLEFVAHHYNHMAVSSFLGGDLESAARVIEYALILAPSHPSFINNRATISAAQGDLTGAIADTSYAVYLAPRVALFRYHLGRLLLQQNRVGASISAFDQALQLKPHYDMAERDRAWALAVSGDLAAARKMLAQAVERKVGMVDGYLYLALLHLAAGARQDAARVAGSGLERSADDSRLQTVKLLAEGRRAEANQVEVGRIERVLKAVVP